MTPHYTINIEWSDEDASFIATVPQLPGCMADGPTETDMPWSAPAAWEGSMPIPGGYMNRYE